MSNINKTIHKTTKFTPHHRYYWAQLERYIPSCNRRIRLWDDHTAQLVLIAANTRLGGKISILCSRKATERREFHSPALVGNSIMSSVLRRVGCLSAFYPYSKWNVQNHSRCPVVPRRDCFPFVRVCRVFSVESWKFRGRIFSW